MDYEIGNVCKGDTEQHNERKWDYVKFTMLQIEEDYDEAIRILEALKDNCNDSNN